jgi:hypothetical protein
MKIRAGTRVFAVVLCSSSAFWSGCAESTPPADSPETSSDSAPGESAPTGEPVGAAESSETSESTAAEATAPASSGGDLSAADLSAALQLVLDDEAVQPYLKLEEPGRFPLKVGGELPSGLNLVKGTKPVIFIAPGATDKAALVFTSIEIGSDKVSVRFHFDVEGIRGAATIEKHEGRWEIKNSRVTEH